jgi:5-methyltetrahydrofolate--homocysteine methyltransferase
MNMQPIAFTEQDWARVERDTLAWWNHELDRPLVHLSVQQPVDAPYAHGYQSNYPLDMPAAEVVEQYAPFFAATRWYADSFPHWWVNFGPGIAAGFLGSEVNSVTEPGETVWFNPPERRPIADWDFQLDPNNPWWLRVQEITRAVIERYGRQVQVAHTDLGGNLDILASFTTTEQLLFDVIEQPEVVDRQVARITELWLRYYAALDQIIRPACRGTSAWSPLWSPGKTYMLQCDFSYMISPKMFERFVVPDLTACCDMLDHGFYHLDGKGEIPHLPHLLGIERLRGIQWIPGDGAPTPDQWLPLLQQIRAGGKLCQVGVSPAGARRIVQNLGGKGFMLIIYGDPAFQNPDEVAAFLKTLREEDISAQ